MRARSALAETPRCAVMRGMHLVMDHEDRGICGEGVFPVIGLHNSNLTRLYHVGRNTPGLETMNIDEY